MPTVLAGAKLGLTRERFRVSVTAVPKEVRRSFRRSDGIFGLPRVRAVGLSAEASNQEETCPLHRRCFALERDVMDGCREEMKCLFEVSG